MAAPEDEEKKVVPLGDAKKQREALRAAAERDAAADTRVDDSAPFRILGHDHGRYFFLPAGAKQIVILPPRQLDKRGLLMVAPLSYWEREYPSKAGANWDSAANTLIQTAHSIGIFDPDKVRGRGVWIDKRRVVVHCGDHLIVDGVATGSTEFDSAYVYESGASLPRPGEPMTTEESTRLVELCKTLSWEKSISGTLLAGWCAIAPICGALAWRPSIWVVGATGSGKGWVVSNIMRPCLGGWHIYSEGDSTAKGLEQNLGSASLPVLFDEAEAEGEAAQARVQNLLFLVRTASSSTGARQYKGTIDGRGRSSQISTLFGFASINPSVKQSADEGRITILPLKVTNDDVAFEALKRKTKALLVPGFSMRLMARTLRLLPAIRRNHESFATAAAKIFGSRRIGDQLGALFAGAYSLESEDVLDVDEASNWIKKGDWDDYTTAGAEPEDRRCLNHLMQQRKRVSINHHIVEITIGEVVAAALGVMGSIEGLRVTAKDELSRIGIRRANNPDDPEEDQKGIYISTSHNALKEIYAGSNWDAGWTLAMSRLPGARVIRAARKSPADKPKPRNIRFGFYSGPAIWLPISSLNMEDAINSS